MGLDRQLTSCIGAYFRQKIQTIKPSSLLEEVGGYMSVLSVVHSFIDSLHSSQELVIPYEEMKSQVGKYAEMIAAYLKETGAHPQQYLLEFYAQFKITNLDFFIGKLQLWKILNEFNYSAHLQTKVFVKFEKIRYIVTVQGQHLNFISQATFRRHLMSGLKQATLLNYFSNKSVAALQDIANHIIDLTLGFYDVQEFVEYLSQKLKRTIDTSFIEHLESTCSEIIHINYQSVNPLLAKDFKMKCNKIRQKFFPQHNVAAIVGDVPRFLALLKEWINKDTITNPLHQDLQFYDQESFQFLRFFFNFCFSDSVLMSFNDILVCRSYYSLSPKLLSFWLIGIRAVLSSDLKVPEPAVDYVLKIIEFYFN